MVKSYQRHSEGEGASTLSHEPTRTAIAIRKCSFSARHEKPFFQIIRVARKVADRIVMQPDDMSSHMCTACPVSLVQPDTRAHTQEQSEVSHPCQLNSTNYPKRKRVV